MATLSGEKRKDRTSFEELEYFNKEIQYMDILISYYTRLRDRYKKEVEKLEKK